VASLDAFVALEVVAAELLDSRVPLQRFPCGSESSSNRRDLCCAATASVCAFCVSADASPTLLVGRNLGDVAI